ncbi:MBL fold metallo-hydrolase [Methanococcoides sp. SA1]|nr:MBL fold metallo-hydrolase [Methanococcoides sp. SA1]
MKVTQIREDVWKFKGTGSVYLIKNMKEWVLIDAGDSSDRDDLVKEIPKVIALNKINVVLLTHLHYDHLGGLDLFSGAEIFADVQEIEDYKDNAEKFHFYVDEKVDKILKEKIKPMDKEMFGLKILKVPGHTRGSVAFLDEKRKLLFSGDTIFGGSIEGRTDLPNSIPEKMEESVKLLRKLVIDEGLGLCPGHGYWEDAQESKE